jgi:hypothetical protein
MSMTTYVLPLLFLAGTIGFMIFMKRRMNTRYAHMRAGEVAQRLGMQLVEGNPAHNLCTQAVLPSVQNVGSARGFLNQIAATQVGGTLGEFKLRMIGQPYGAAAELVLYCREDFQPGFTHNTTTTWSDCRLTIHARTAVVPFDLRLRQEMMGLETRERDDDEPRMPPQGFGDAALDQRFVIETYDPQLPRRIAGALAPIAHVLPYVHVVGAGNQVSFVMTPQTVMASAACFEQVLHALVSIAAIHEGRAVPGAMAAAPAPAPIGYGHAPAQR